MIVRGWGMCVALAVLQLAVVGAIAGCSDDEDAKKQKAAAAQRSAKLSEAKSAVRVDEYEKAIATVAALGAADREAVRVQIANRLAERTMDALPGRRVFARQLVIEAKGYASTETTRRARIAYKRAKARAARRRARAAKRRRAQAARRRRQQQSRPVPPIGSGGSSCPQAGQPCYPGQSYPKGCICVPR